MRYHGRTPSSLPLGSALSAWAVLMLIVWALFVPRGLPIDTFSLLTLTGPLVLLAADVASRMWRLPRHP
jgi:hypothetical protein